MSGPTQHSEYSASGFEAAMLCPGKRVMERGLPDSSSKYADEGTAAHTLFGWCIENDRDAAAYRGRRIPVGLHTFEVDDEMMTPVQAAVDAVRARTAGGFVLSEQQVNYSRYLGVDQEEAWGTSDIISVVGSELGVDDYKHGRGVEVFAEENPQMMLYALGALEAVEDTLGPFDTVRLTIHQPRIKSEPSEWVTTPDALRQWAAEVANVSVIQRQTAQGLRGSMLEPDWQREFLQPNEKSCKFCRAKATCPALRAEATQTVFEVVPASPDEFDSLRPAESAKQSSDDWLAKVLGKADLIEDYLKAVRAEVERRLLEGKQIPGFKIVQGRAGNRAWSDADEVEKQFKAMRLPVEVMYDLKLISPTSAEKLAKTKVIGPRQWKALQERITRSDGAKHVAPVTDPRPALSLTPAVDDFAPVSVEQDFA